MKITENVFVLDSTRGSYVYLIAGDEPILIDTGRPDQRRAVLGDLGRIGVAPRDIKHILLTHHDIDHVGSAAFLQQSSGAKVWVSEEDSHYVSGEIKRPGIKAVAEFVFRPAPPKSLSIYGHEPAPPGITVLPTPGHTPGHVCILYHDVLFAGDLIEVSRGHVRPYPNFWNWNTPLLLESIKTVESKPFHWLCPTHGTPVERQPGTPLVR